MPRAVIAAIAFSCLSSTGQAQPVTSSTTAEARAVVVKPLSLVKTADMDFGELTVTAGGTATLNPYTGALTLTGGLQSVGGSPHQASFVGATRQFSLIWIRFPRSTATLRRVGGIETLTLSNFTLDGGAFRLVGGGPLAFRVGGRLTVPAGTVDGNYVGNFDVTIDYF